MTDVTHPPVRRRVAWYFAAMGIIAAGWLAHLAGVDTGPLAGFFERWASPTLIFAAGAACMARAVLVRFERVAWLLAGVAILSWGTGLLYFTVFQWNLEEIPVPSIADAFWLIFYPPAYLALVLLFRVGTSGIGRTLWVDGVIAGLAIASVGSAVVFHAVLDHLGGKPLGVATNVAYPLADLLLAALVIGALVMRGWPIDRRWLWIGAGLLMFALSDSVYLQQVATGAYQAGTILETGWAFAMIAIAWAAWRPASPRVSVQHEAWRTIALPVAFATVALAVGVYDHFVRVDLLSLILATVCLATVLARMTLTFGENRRMLLTSRHEATTDPLTGLGNRRKLTRDMHVLLDRAGQDGAVVMALFDLDGFKLYNDSFGHPAGDALLTRLGAGLAGAVGHDGKAYRIGGDEFCVLRRLEDQAPEREAARWAAGLSEHGEGFEIGCSFGFVVLPHETNDAEEALRIADRRLYACKQGGRSSAQRQSTDVLLQALSERHPGLGAHLNEVTLLAEATAKELHLPDEEIERIRLTAELHDIGKVAIPDSILNKPEGLDVDEWAFIRRHTLIGERIVSAAPALGPVAPLVRSSHERWDGDGYPDGLVGEAIPIAARVVMVCDAYHAMTADRPYRRAMSAEVAMDELRRCAGSQFDPSVVEAFCNSTLAEDALATIHEV
jgi:two-component system cell cycle response regulator